jgi:hypothetical protein
VKTAFRILGILAILTVAASATTITTTPVTYDGSLSYAGTSSLLNVVSFDSSLGTLISVNITLTGAAEVGYSIQDRSGLPSTFAVSVPLTVTLRQGTTSLGTVVTNVVDVTTHNLAGNGYFETENYGTGVLALTASNSQGYTLTDALLLALFSGDGTSKISLTASGTKPDSVWTSTSPDYGTNLTAKYTPTVEISYTYETTTTPEPAPVAMALGGVAFLALGIFRRRLSR